MSINPPFNTTFYSQQPGQSTIGICLPLTYNSNNQNFPTRLQSRLSYLVFTEGDEPNDANNHMSVHSLAAVVHSPGDKSTYAAGTNKKIHTLSNPSSKPVSSFNKDEIAFYVQIPGLPDNQIHSVPVITHNAAYQAEDLDAYYSDCDETQFSQIALWPNSQRNGSEKMPITEEHN
ncbi:hypothetical protein Tco_0053193 [Tanacetum coccineum]